MRDDHTHIPTDNEQSNIGARATVLLESVVDDIDHGRLSYSPSAILESVLNHAGTQKSLYLEYDIANAVTLFDLLMQNSRLCELADTLEVVAIPGNTPAAPLQKGDLLLRRARGEGNLGSASMIADERLLSNLEISRSGIVSESLLPGTYVCVLENFPEIRGLSGAFARRILDSEGKLLSDSAIVRVRHQIRGLSEDEDDETHGLPEDDEESWLEFDTEFVEPHASPNGANAPFAQLSSGSRYWPIITSHPQGRTVSYRTFSGAWIGYQLRSFGADRSSGTRYHVGVDLFGRLGDSVVAIGDGRIIRFFPFCCGDNKTSWALLVEHGQIVVNYGEVAPDSLSRNGLAVGSNVRGGQVIARVGRNPGGTSMIHFETYTSSTTRTYQWLKGQARPVSLLNPTRLLLQLKEQGLPVTIAGSTVRVQEVHTESYNDTCSEQIDENDWYSEDGFAETGVQPSRTWARCRRYTADDARWAADNVSPDYRHLNVAGMSQVFTFNAGHLETLCRLNSFNVTVGQDEVLFGLRGCTIQGGDSEGEFVSSVSLSEDMPDHFAYHCVLGVWKKSTRQIAVFKGSTVPNWGHMCRQVQLSGNTANLLPTGLYLYNVGRHRIVDGAFILGSEVVVLRSNNDLIYDTNDLWEVCTPADNIHPGFHPSFAEFSSAGCQTVSGNFSNSRHSGSWATFRIRAGLNPHNNLARYNDQFVYILLTGREARLVSTGSSAPLNRLRFGSKGPGVQALQMDLRRRGLYAGTVDGALGPRALMAYIQWQKARDHGAADGIVTSSAGRLLGFDLIRRQSVRPSLSGARRYNNDSEQNPQPATDWAAVPSDQRIQYVMNLLVNQYRYPVNGASGLVGNLWAESGVLPNRIEGSDIATPMRAQNYSGQWEEFTAEQVMNRNRRTRQGPRRPGVGLAQWTSQNRRAGLFQYQFNGRQLGPAILYDMDAQIDYLFHELQTLYQRVNRILMSPGVTVNAASDEVVYSFEVPGRIIHDRRRLPRSNPAVQEVFLMRRSFAQRALRVYRSAHPSSEQA